MKAFARLSLCALIASAPIAMVHAQDFAPGASATLSADTLAPGQFRWASDVSGSAPLTVKVSIARQIAYVYRGSTLIGVTTVSTGKEGHETPTGSFPILQKEVMHHSNLYDSAPMPFMQRLTWDGIALHSGRIPGYAASHGCVRLPNAFAKTLFGLTRVGATVTIMDDFADEVVTTAVAEPAPVYSAPRSIDPAITMVSYTPATH